MTYLGLTDHQLKLVMQAARPLPVEKRDVFLRRIAARLKLEGRFTDADVAKAATEAIFGLMHEVA
jgi:hypothetical protein